MPQDERLELIARRAADRVWNDHVKESVGRLEKRIDGLEKRVESLETRLETQNFGGVETATEARQAKRPAEFETDWQKLMMDKGTVSGPPGAACANTTGAARGGSCPASFLS